MEATKKPPVLYSPAVTVLLAIGLFIGTQIVVALLLSIIPLALGWSQAQTQAWLTNSSWAQFLFVLLVQGITLKLVWELLKRRQASFKTLGLNNPKLKYAAYALGGFVAYFFIYIASVAIIKTLVPALNLEQEQQLGFSKAATGAELIPIFISLVILPPIVEEIVARGFVYTSLRAKLPVISASLITSVLFAAAHLGGAAEGLLWVAAIDTFVLSMVLCQLREKTGSLWPPIGLHFIKNGLAFFVLFNISQYFR